MQSKPLIDELLRQKSADKEIPGVVAMAANGNAVIYQGAYGKRDLSKDDARQRVLDRLDDQGDYGRGRHATGRARQALTRRADRQGAARSSGAASVRRVRQQWRAESAAREM